MNGAIKELYEYYLYGAKRWGAMLMTCMDVYKAVAECNKMREIYEVKQ